jgi:spoIIIJ-associated protein
MADIASEKVKEWVTRIAHDMGIECMVAVHAPEDGLSPIAVDVQAPEGSKLLIGKNGQNLRALEHVVRAMFVRHTNAHRPLVIDVNDYRKEKTRELVDIVKQAAGRVRDTGRSEALPPMTSYERRIAHTELAAWSEVSTESVGQEPQRRVVIKPL